MAQTKATSDALMAMAEQLRQSAEQIQAAKASMNNQLHSFSWDDPVGIAFINDYHEKMKPIDNKLLPELEGYSDHLEKLVGGIEEYNGGSAIHITGTENIARVLPKGSGVDPITISADSKVHIPDTPLKVVESDSTTIPKTLPNLEINEPMEVDGREIELVPDENGMGTNTTRWAGKLGAGVDAMAKESPVTYTVAMGSAKIVDSCISGVVPAIPGGGIACAGAAATLVGLGTIGVITKEEEIKQLDKEAGGPHDVCYLKQEGRDICDAQFAEKAPISAVFVRRWGQKAYEEAGEEFKEHLEISQKIGKEAPKGFHWRYKKD